MMEIITKVYIYITHGERIAVLRYVEFPEAGIQVPGGLVEPGENLADAALREAIEETGLEGLSTPAFIGEAFYHHQNPEFVHRRYYYHIIFKGDPPEKWRHWEMTPSTGEPPVELELWFAALDEVEKLLVWEMDEMIPALKEAMIRDD